MGPELKGGEMENILTVNRRILKYQVFCFFVQYLQTHLLISVQDVSLLGHLKQVSNSSYPILLYLFRAIYCYPSSKSIMNFTETKMISPLLDSPGV